MTEFVWGSLHDSFSMNLTLWPTLFLELESLSWFFGRRTTPAVFSVSLKSTHKKFEEFRFGKRLDVDAGGSTLVSSPKDVS